MMHVPGRVAEIAMSHQAGLASLHNLAYRINGPVVLRSWQGGSRCSGRISPVLPADSWWTGCRELHLEMLRTLL